MNAIIFTTTIFLCLKVAYGQSEKLNQFDNQGKKDGKWVVYLDARWNKVDSSKAVYYRYTWFEHGTNIHPMGAGGNKDSKMETTTDTSKQKGKIKILDGEYKWYEDRNLRYVHVLKDGEYISYKEYTSSGQLLTHFDYTKGCEGQPRSWTIYLYDKKGNLKMTSLTCKDKEGKWPVMND